MLSVPIGRLRHRIVLQRFEETKDASGAWVEAWVNVATVWASVEPLRGQEYFAAQSLQVSQTTVRIRIRYRPGVDAAMRVLYGGKTYVVDSVIEPLMRHGELQLMCKVYLGG